MATAAKPDNLLGPEQILANAKAMAPAIAARSGEIEDLRRQPASSAWAAAAPRAGRR